MSNKILCYVVSFADFVIHINIMWLISESLFGRQYREQQQWNTEVGWGETEVTRCVGFFLWTKSFQAIQNKWWLHFFINVRPLSLFSGKFQLCRCQSKPRVPLQRPVIWISTLWLEKRSRITGNIDWILSTQIRTFWKGISLLTRKQKIEIDSNIFIYR